MSVYRANSLKELNQHIASGSQAPGNVVNIDLIQRGVGGDIGWASGSMANPP